MQPKRLGLEMQPCERTKTSRKPRAKSSRFFVAVPQLECVARTFLTIFRLANNQSDGKSHA